MKLFHAFVYIASITAGLIPFIVVVAFQGTHIIVGPATPLLAAISTIAAISTSLIILDFGWSRIAAFAAANQFTTFALSVQRITNTRDRLGLILVRMGTSSLPLLTFAAVATSKNVDALLFPFLGMCAAVAVAFAASVRTLQEASKADPTTH